MGGKGSTTIQQPDPIDPSQSAGEFLFGKNFKSFGGITDPALQQKLLDAEAEFRPQYQALELADQEAALFGSDGQAGLIKLQKRASEAFAPIEQAAKEREVALLGSLGGQVTEALRRADPAAARLQELQQQQAEKLYAEAEGDLSPERQRQVDQAARASGMARGRGRDASVDAAAVLGREDARANLRQQAQRAGQMGFSQARQIGGDPSQFLFGRPAQSTTMGSQLYGQATALAGQQAGPQLFDPNMGINMAMQQRSQDMNLLGAQIQADAANRSSLLGAAGSIGAAFICWVAREVYGVQNPKWLRFRAWMLQDSPPWFLNLYMRHGEKLAKFISNKPMIKSIIRKWMDGRIK
jgi:hypothetical protein